MTKDKVSKYGTIRRNLRLTLFALWIFFKKGGIVIMDYEGFLGNDLKSYREKILSKYESLFQFHREFNTYLNKMRLNISVKDDDYRGIVMIRDYHDPIKTLNEKSYNNLTLSKYI